jgi:hypothetical protein
MRSGLPSTSSPATFGLVNKYAILESAIQVAALSFFKARRVQMTSRGDIVCKPSE